LFLKCFLGSECCKSDGGHGTRGAYTLHTPTKEKTFIKERGNTRKGRRRKRGVREGWGTCCNVSG